MKKIIPLIFLILLSSLGISQTVTVSESDQAIEKINRTGLSTTLELDRKFVEGVLKKELKEYGKVKKSGDFYMVEVAKVPSISASPIRLYGMVKSSGSKGTLLWVAFDAGDAFITKSHGKYEAAKKIVHELGVRAYTTDINKDISAAESAVSKASKECDKMRKKGGSLESDMKRNKERKEQLEKDIVDNAEQKVQLEKDIEQNKKDQKTANEKMAKMEKALELQKQKLTNVR